MTGRFLHDKCMLWCICCVANKVQDVWLKWRSPVTFVGNNAVTLRSYKSSTTCVYSIVFVHCRMYLTKAAFTLILIINSVLCVSYERKVCSQTFIVPILNFIIYL